MCFFGIFNSIQADVSLLAARNKDLGPDYPVPPPPLHEEFNYPKESQIDQSVFDTDFSPSSDSFRSSLDPARDQNEGVHQEYLSQTNPQVYNDYYTYTDNTRISDPTIVYEIEPQNVQFYRHISSFQYEPSLQAQNVYKQSAQSASEYQYPGTKKDSTGYHYAVPENPFIY